MNRVIKFRLWNSAGENSKMFYDTEQAMECLKQQLLFNDKSHKYHHALGYDHEGNGSAFMQFTGIETHKKVQIWEGDVVHLELPMGGFWGNIKKERTGVVKYSPDCGGFIVEWEYSKNQHHILLTSDTAFNAEVIGNIHENPELLNTTV